MMEKNAKIYVAGHRGMVGSAIVRELQRQGYTNIITRTHKELDLCRQQDVEDFFAAEKPEYVFLAAAKVGGIVANQEALADFMYYNMTLEMNAIHSAWQNGCKKLEFLGSSCIYPRMAPQPMQESCLLTSELEKTNEAYALAKISDGSDEIPNALRQGHIAYVINTRDPGANENDGLQIRQIATEHNVTLFTALDTIKVLLDVLEETTLAISTIDGE